MDNQDDQFVVHGAALAEDTGRVDELLSRAAKRWPDRPALVDAARTWTYAELDAAADVWAGYLQRRVPGTGQVIALAALLRAEFVAAYYGILRAGHVVAPFVPLLREPGLAYNLGLVKARLALVDAEVGGRLANIRAQLPELVDVIRLDEPADGPAAPAETAPLPARTCCVLFTSGTTGAPKAVALSHRNVVANAVQVARAHEVTEASICVNHLPTFHPMHMNSAIATGATQVLCAGPDFADAVAAANRHAATHLYSLPVRLIRGVDEGLSGLSLPAGTAIASGGSALPTRIAKTLSEHFEIPVFQGYGLAETSPLTHSDGPVDPVAGSVGYPVAGTECRVVGLDSRAALPSGEVGEVQVRGPQVMLGYLTRDLTVDGSGCVDAEGWLSTGDVARIDADGRLFLVDRLKDVFKCDNWLVAPSEIEAVAEGHPLVRECVVFDVPDEFSGAVAAGYAVLEPGAESAPVVEYVNDRVPYYQRLHRLTAVDRIPRSPNGKVQRRDLRYAMITGQLPDPTAELTVVNTFTLKSPALAEEFEGRFLAHVQYMRAQNGFVAHQMIRFSDRPDVYVNVGWWRRPEDFQKILASDVFQEHAREFHQLVEVEAAPSRSLPAVRAGAEIGREDSAYPVLVVERFTVTDLDRFTAAYATYAAGVPAQDLAWVDLAAGLRSPLSYTAVSRWSSAQAHRAAQQSAAYQAVLEHSTVAVDYGSSVAASRFDAVGTPVA
ncbi:MAG: hypothetical protein AUI14_05270 [Actinobacteria bacterium 13_2_20CM_2_71_6]|nr:MAG: hypothetical protein AUI14_05270 [Actinobacteria bacterium 13_2_20CM_2_71_6]